LITEVGYNCNQENWKVDCCELPVTYQHLVASAHHLSVFKDIFSMVSFFFNVAETARLINRLKHSLVYHPKEAKSDHFINLDHLEVTEETLLLNL
jgi:hypothetical protein